MYTYKDVHILIFILQENSLIHYFHKGLRAEEGGKKKILNRFCFTGNNHVHPCFFKLFTASQPSGSKHAEQSRG